VFFVVKNESRWYRGTPVVLILDEACFYFHPEWKAEPELQGVEIEWNR
jgi:hypothetical protein